eukprot:GEZU01021672.1.p1 GENE.GEZU01021672.1~~GEZU01021672.1.p1  ORF type:complete len:170 (+),score=38.83 GEZU01021672.1:88-597(+)
MTTKEIRSAHKKWTVHFNDYNNDDYEEPYGFVNIPSTATEGSEQRSNKKGEEEQLQRKKAWEEAIAPGKNLMMTAFMLWMSGNSVQIFSIIITFMSIWQPIKAIMNTHQVFSKFTVNTTKEKAIFILCHCVGLAAATLKCYYMGLLPHPTDWVKTTVPQPVELSFGQVL